MKKTLIASAIALATLSGAAQASISVTNMAFSGGNYASTGTINTDGTGAFNSIDPFFGQPWTATVETQVITSSNGVTFAGSSAAGAYDYADDIANMSATQTAVGTYFNWNGNNGIAVLAVFDCAAGVCTGAAAGTAAFGGMDNGPFSGQLPLFEGTGSLDAPAAVPVPAAVWLFGSGLVGLAGVARRRKAS